MLIFVVPVLLLLRLNVALRGIDVSRGIFRFSPYSLTIWSVVSGLVALLVFISFSGVQNWRIWTRLRALLQQLNSIPVREVFKEVAADTSSLQIWKIGSNRRSFLLQYRTLEVMRMMEPVVAEQTTQQRTFAASASFDGGTAAITPKSHPTTTITATTTTSTTAGSGPTTATATKTETTIKAASELALSVKPGYHGQLDRLAQTIYESERTETGKTRWMNCSKVPEISRILNLRLAECRPLLVCFDDKDAPQSEKLKAKYLALRFSALIRYSMVQIRNMLWFCLWGYVCLLLSVRLYPFQGRHTLSLLMTIVFMALLLAIGGMFSQMESDPILGRLEDAKNVGESSFLRVAGKLLSVGGVPLLAVLASQFPAFAELVSGWIKPISDALH